MRPLPLPGVILALLVVGVVAAPGWASDRAIDYLYVEANEGGSSGGHVGVRVGDDVFHFEHQRPGILVLRREPFAEFRHRYTGFENRAIEVRRIPVSEDAYRRVLERLGRRHLVQRRHLETLGALRENRAILEEMLRGRLHLDGAGFFGDVNQAGESRPMEPALVALRQRVRDAYGADFLPRRLEAIRQRLGALDFRLQPDTTADISEDEITAPRYDFPQRYLDTLSALTALQILTAAQPLLPRTTITADSVELRLREDEAHSLPQLAGALAASLVRLLDSRRPDWGFSLLLGMARLAALDRTRESGRWVFLDAFPSNADVTEQTPVAGAARTIITALRDAEADLDVARGRLFSRLLHEGRFTEREFAELEESGNRVAEIRVALDEARDPRLPRQPWLPARRGVRPSVLAPSQQVLAANLAVAIERETTYGAALKGLYPYHVITRNCVSELFKELDAALLGDRGDDPGAFTFIPALSALAVNERYGVSEVFRIPSYRHAALARLYAESNPLGIFLRESNTVSSTLYRRNPHDSVFLFFTDDVVVTRPIFGAVNLATGLAVSAVGLVASPFDRGVMIRAGLKGAAFSLPELFFQNIRKGSFEYVEPAADEARSRSAGREAR
jgi:hypothetical protein